MVTEYLKHMLIRTPVEPAAHWLKYQIRLARGLSHPELSGLLQEGRHLAQSLKRLLRADSNCIDIGAHLGSQLSTFVALAPRGKHIAVEPVPYKAKWLQQKFPEVAIHEVALSDRSGQVTFSIHTSRTGYSSLGQQLESGEKIEQITVQQTSLDALLDEAQRVDFIKIDVEGWELFVLKGAERLLTRGRPSLVFESTADGLNASGATPDEMFELLSAHDYQLHVPEMFAVGGSALSRHEFQAAHLYPFRAFNFLATPRRTSI